MKRASQLYDMCVKKLGEDCEKGKDNLTAGEKRGLKSLKKRVTEGEIIICQTDKSGRFCVLTREQYLEAGLEHTKNDRMISQEEIVPKYAYNRIMKKLKTKVQSRRLEIRSKKKNKITKYKEEKDLEELEELSKLQEEMGEFGQLKIFQGTSIQPEERKPPVLSKEVTLSKYEMEVL